MYDDAYEILDYLPIYRAGLTEYIDHLWGAFESTIEKEYPVRPFSLFPFHLLSMLAIQYKVFRISAYRTQDYLKCLEECNHRIPDEVEILKKNIPVIDQTTGQIPHDISVRNLSFLSERRLFTFLKIIGVDNQVIESGQNLVDIRGKYAHANGNIEENLEEKIDQYLDIHRNIQHHMIVMNDDLATRWTQDLEIEDMSDEYIGFHLATEFLAPKDLQFGKLATDIAPKIKV